LDFLPSIFLPSRSWQKDGGKKMAEREESGLDGGEGNSFFMVTLSQAIASKFVCASIRRAEIPAAQLLT